MCEHENFRTDVLINRLLDSKAFVADIRIKCIDCNEDFTFPGLPIGLSCSEVRVSWDEKELRVP